MKGLGFYLPQPYSCLQSWDASVASHRAHFERMSFEDDLYGSIFSDAGLCETAYSLGCGIKAMRVR